MRSFTRFFLHSAILAVLLCALVPAPAHAVSLAQTAPTSPTIPDPLKLDDKAPVADLVSRLVKAFLGIVGIIALVIFLYGGFLWLTAGGNSSKIEEGRNMFVWAVLGLVVIFSSYAIVSFVFDRLLQLNQ